MTAGSEQQAAGGTRRGAKVKVVGGRIFGFACLLPAVFLPAGSLAQPKKIPLIGYLSSGTAASEAARSQAIRLALRNLGHIEGQNIAIEFRYGNGKLDRARRTGGGAGTSQR
jgi:hypothetical protein